MTQLTVIIAYLVLLILLGIVASRYSRNTSSDYLFASHAIGPLLLLLTLFGTCMTSFAIIGSTGEAYRRGIGVYGLLASSSGIVHSLCFFLVGVPLWRLGRQYGYRTQIQYFRDRLDSNNIGLVLFPVLVGLVMPYMLTGVLGAGTFCNVVTRGAFEPGTFPASLEAAAQGGVPTPIASLVLCVVVLIYVFFGGMRATAWANAFQTCLFMLLGLATFYLLAQKLGGGDSLLANLQTLSSDPDIPVAKKTRAEFSRLHWFSYLTIPLSVAMFPHIFQQWLTARQASTFKLTVVMHPLFIMLLWLPCVLLGYWATGLALPEEVASDPNKVLPYLVGLLDAPLMMGLLAAGVLAAILGGLDSQFLCVGSLFTEDIVLRYCGRDRFSERQVVALARTFVVLVVAVVYWLSLVLDGRGVFPLGVWCFSGFAGLFPLVCAALYWRRLTKWGAYAGVLTAAATWIGLFVASGYGAPQGQTFTLAGVDVALAGETLRITLGNQSYACVVALPIMLLATAAIVVVSLATRPPSDAKLAKFFADPAAIK